MRLRDETTSIPSSRVAVRRVAVVGGGAIGAGWAARFVQNGIDVRVYDPGTGLDERLARVIFNARRAWEGLDGPGEDREGRCETATSLAEAVDGADVIVESVPEELDTKREAYARVEAVAGPAALIASSTSGLRPSELQAEMAHPERFVVAHPFHPVYLLPLVEVVPGERTEAETVRRAMDLYESVGMAPLPVRREIDGFIADRLLEAMWREALWLVHDGVATTAEIDDAVRLGFGLRFAQMGMFETYRIAGGEAGMRHFLAQFGPCLQWPWTKLTDVPDLDDALVEKIASQSDEQSGRHSLGDLERIRDENLVGILQALRRTDWGAGRVLNARREGPGGGPARDRRRP